VLPPLSLPPPALQSGAFPKLQSGALDGALKENPLAIIFNKLPWVDCDGVGKVVPALHLIGMVINKDRHSANVILNTLLDPRTAAEKRTKAEALLRRKMTCGQLLTPTIVVTYKEADELMELLPEKYTVDIRAFKNAVTQHVVAGDQRVHDVLNQNALDTSTLPQVARSGLGISEAIRVDSAASANIEPQSIASAGMEGGMERGMEPPSAVSARTGMRTGMRTNTRTFPEVRSASETRISDTRTEFEFETSLKRKRVALEVENEVNRFQKECLLIDKERISVERERLALEEAKAMSSAKCETAKGMVSIELRRASIDLEKAQLSLEKDMLAFDKDRFSFEIKKRLVLKAEEEGGDILQILQLLAKDFVSQARQTASLTKETLPLDSEAGLPARGAAIPSRDASPAAAMRGRGDGLLPLPTRAASRSSSLAQAARTKKAARV
jgi:hypothetical protein